ncbi:stromal interaction molecule 2-like [Solea senegalensis]|uniref:Stromal interaction molecule 2-like n=1 Tax=Solea senegalensis TaxID=28829 RepID=A0AAV6Q753_SOLSE|nr:stromal interaction molecule 2-like isoform X1 [Solea senegalensis]KAG7485428.1 stromal interaction molecule 2-like [Solea senegalensis]
MLPLSPLLLLVFPAAVLVAAQSAGDLHGFTLSSGSTGSDPADPCMGVYPPCMSEADRFSLEALRSIHHMMDDDKDGGIEVEESMEFIIEDMKQQQTNKHSNLHREDQHITIEELWRGWKSSEVHNWTQDDVLRWLKDFVELPQYERNFKDFKANGNTLPRIAANEPSFLSGHLRVQDQRDKQKLNIKALDVVLFGPPTRPPHNYMKDLLLIVSVVMGVGGCWFAQVQNKASKVHITKMMKDLESLQRAEQSLMDLQGQLELAQEEKRNVAEQKQNLEEKMRDEIMGAQEEAYRLHELRQGAVTELSRLRYAEEELEQVRGALKQAEKDIQASWTASEALQLWLQLTHEVEVQYYNVKKQSAELQLATAKEEAERIKKKRSSVFGTLHVAHSSSLDQVDHKILGAKNALSEVTACLRERLHRWQKIERLCGFPIIKNPGLANLTAQLYSDSITLGLPRVSQTSCSCHSSVHGSIEDLLEDSASPILPHMQVTVPPLKHSPRTQGSLCRPRRVIAQPPSTMISSDPDLLIPIRAPYPCFDEEENFLLKTLKKQDSQEKFSDADYMTSPPLSKMFHSPMDASSQKLYHNDTELLGDPSIAKVEAVPVHKIATEELEGSVDVGSRRMAKDKLLESPLEPHSLKMSREDSLVDATSRKMSRDRMDVPIDVTVRKGIPSEMDVEFSTRKGERETVGDLTDTALRNIYRERGDIPLDMRKMIWNELETTEKQAPRKISRDMMGSSFDSISRKIIRDDAEHLLDSGSRRITRDSQGMSFDSVNRKLQRSKGESQLDSSVRAVAVDKMVEPTVTPRKISGEELEYSTDTASLKMLPRETRDALMDTSFSTEQEFGLEQPTNRWMLRDELELSAGSLRRRTSRMPRDAPECAVDNPTGNICNKVDCPLEIPRHSTLTEELETSESSSFPVQFDQPDLMVTSKVPLTPIDPFTVGPLSQLVYDGILEKSRNSMATNPTSLSTPNLYQKKLLAEVEPPVPPPRAAVSSLASPPETKEDKTKEKEKSRKSLKLKSIFKKKPESTSEKTQSGLHKL